MDDSGVERNHKTANSVMSQLPCRLTDLSLQKQVSVAFNGNQFNGSLLTTRGAGFEKVLSSLCDSGLCRQPTMVQFISSNRSLDISGLYYDILRLETCLLDINDSTHISDDLKFFNDSY